MGAGARSGCFRGVYRNRRCLQHGTGRAIARFAIQHWQFDRSGVCLSGVPPSCARSVGTRAQTRIWCRAEEGAYPGMKPPGSAPSPDLRYTPSHGNQTAYAHAAWLVARLNPAARFPTHNANVMPPVLAAFSFLHADDWCIEQLEHCEAPVNDPSHPFHDPDRRPDHRPAASRPLYRLAARARSASARSQSVSAARRCAGADR
ncbi:hypothetical protein PSP6_440340 [Paraburkholderia tropica]|nr:hypothetical protein PSP6_440340 [Paraburkholderia tropica]